MFSCFFCNFSIKVHFISLGSFIRLPFRSGCGSAARFYLFFKTKLDLSNIVIMKSSKSWCFFWTSPGRSWDARHIHIYTYINMCVCTQIHMSTYVYLDPRMTEQATSTAHLLLPDPHAPWRPKVDPKCLSCVPRCSWSSHLCEPPKLTVFHPYQPYVWEWNTSNLQSNLDATLSNFIQLWS